MERNYSLDLIQMKKSCPLATTHCQSVYKKSGRKRPGTTRKSLSSPPGPQEEMMLSPVEVMVCGVCGETPLQEVLRGGCRSALACLAASGGTSSPERRKQTRGVTGGTLFQGKAWLSRPWAVTVSSCAGSVGFARAPLCGPGPGSAGKLGGLQQPAA